MKKIIKLFIIILVFNPVNAFSNYDTFNKYYGKYKNEAENQYYSDVQEMTKMCGNYETTINSFRSFMNETLLQEKLKQENQLVFKQDKVKESSSPWFIKGQKSLFK